MNKKSVKICKWNGAQDKENFRDLCVKTLGSLENFPYSEIHVYVPHCTPINNVEFEKNIFYIFIWAKPTNAEEYLQLSTPQSRTMPYFYDPKAPHISGVGPTVYGYNNLMRDNIYIPKIYEDKLLIFNPDFWIPQGEIIENQLYIFWDAIHYDDPDACKIVELLMTNVKQLFAEGMVC